MTSRHVAALTLVFGVCAAALARPDGALPVRVRVDSGEATLVPIRLQGYEGEPAELAFEGPFAAGGFELALLDDAGAAVRRLRLDGQSARLHVVAPSECEPRRQSASLIVTSPTTGRSVPIEFEVVASPSLSSCGAAVTLRWIGGALTVLFAGFTGFATILLGSMAWNSQFLRLDILAGRLQHVPGFDEHRKKNRLAACLPWWRRAWYWLRLGIGRKRYHEAVEVRLRDGLSVRLVDGERIGDGSETGRFFAKASANGLKVLGYPDADGLFEGALRTNRQGREALAPLAPSQVYHLTDGSTHWTVRT